MKKTLLVWLGMVLVAGCGTATPSDQTSDTAPETINQDVNATNPEMLQPLTNNIPCDEAIATYLADHTAAWNGDGVVVWDSVEVDYIGRFDAAKAFDTSVVDVAASCGIHNPYRDYNEALSFVAWAGTVIKGFDQWIMWMKEWETKTITIAAADAYGEYDPEKKQTVTLDQLPPNEAWYKVGDELGSPIGKVKILEVNDNEVVIDLNHELAGKDLIFDVTVKKITKQQN